MRAQPTCRSCSRDPGGKAPTRCWNRGLLSSLPSEAVSVAAGRVSVGAGVSARVGPLEGGSATPFPLPSPPPPHPPPHRSMHACTRSMHPSHPRPRCRPAWQTCARTHTCTHAEHSKGMAWPAPLLRWPCHLPQSSLPYPTPSPCSTMLQPTSGSARRAACWSSPGPVSARCRSARRGPARGGGPTLPAQPVGGCARLWRCGWRWHQRAWHSTRSYWLAHAQGREGEQQECPQTRSMHVCGRGREHACWSVRGHAWALRIQPEGLATRVPRVLNSSGHLISCS
jgi:hypothetical protein